MWRGNSFAADSPLMASFLSSSHTVNGVYPLFSYRKLAPKALGLASELLGL